MSKPHNTLKGSQYEVTVPTVRDRIVQAAAKIVLEPIFEADMLESNNDEDVLRTRVRQRLGQHLPVQMVPTDIHFLEAMRLTPNGKVDRVALSGR